MVDLLDSIAERNPELIREAVKLHRSGEIPPDTFIVDLDAIGSNTLETAAAAKSNGIRLYYMSKQFGRNPLICKEITKSGVQKAVTIDVDECKILHNFGFQVGHVGHLSQIPEKEIRYILDEVAPEVVTAYSMDKAKSISEAASSLSIEQDILLRVHSRMDFSYPRQISPGGFLEEQLSNELKTLTRMHGIHVAGVTSFPVFRTDLKRREIFPLPNAGTLIRSATVLARFTGNVKQVNMPADNTSKMFPMARSAAGQFGDSVYLEPGHGLAGMTPLHAFRSDLPEIPAIAYVSEISHITSEEAYAFGGGMMGADSVTGLWSPDYHSHYMHSIVSHNLDEPPSFNALASPVGFIDYYIPVRQAAGGQDEFRTGDTVILGFRPQIFVTRSHVAIVRGIHAGKPELLGLFDSRGNLLDRRTLSTKTASETKEVINSV